MLLGALPPALVSLLLVATGASAAPYNFLNNYRDPVPSPEDGPPAAYHAIRNKDVLPYEICGVVGGYVLTVLVWGVLLLTVGRRMRRKALDPPMQLELELQGKPIRPSLKTPSLASPPLSARSFFRRFKRNGSSDSTPQSPEVSSPTSFDQKVVDAHRDQNQADMERLYAAVMDFDAQKHASKVSVEQPEPAPIQTERRRPSAINVNHAQNDNNDSPVSPVKAIYPPSYSDRPTTAPLPHDRLRAEQQAPPSPRGILTKRSQVLNPNASSKNARFNLKNLRISGPIAKYPGDSDDEARTPLSPPINTIHPSPSPPPNAPPNPKPHQHPRQPLPPLRSFAEPLASPGIQTTVLDHRVDKLSMQTPKTGVPFTPYSPYMPFTPVTPVTPHLTTRRDRKMEAKLAKLEGRRRQAANELVQTPKEIFGDAW
ncbi:Pneumo-att-G multi-domain protein [Pyrenophora tritici-repentis]|uniref:Pneumo-att-G multi-domain protein n=1 Tax=Pyrenophora tritici-repentis TaxID=45151 RepID=A0A317AFZ9_9PLEO|nr:Pneumo-att-G multi-domain protein [Pyrenophora tritici-repentis]